MTAPHSPETAELVASIASQLREQAGLLERLEESGARQSQLAESGDAAALLAHLAGREPIIARLTELSARVGPRLAAWDRLLESLPGAESQRLSDLRRRVEFLAASIADRDARDRAAVRRRADGLAADLGSVRRGRVANAAYVSGEPAGARFQDRRG